MLQRLSVLIIASALALLQTTSMAASKKPQEPDEFPPNPLEITTPDPLIPAKLDKKQPFTPLQLQQLEAALDKLNQEAAAKRQAGENSAAFEIWNRELRLRRYLGSLPEVQALSRVGAIAWNENERLQVRYITQRLQAIQKQAQSDKSADLQLLQALGQAYQQVRNPKAAVEVYDEVLTIVRQQGDVAAEVETLQRIGEVHMSWFDYPQAATAYEQLLKMASSRGDTVSEVEYLQELAYIYQQAKEPNKSVIVRNKLLAIYQKENNLTLIPALRLAIASDYEVLSRENSNLLQEAFTNYQQAYTTAWELQQYARAGEALEKLIALYRSEGQLDEALQASQILVQAQEQATNLYGLMNAYDKMGQIFLERKDYPQALTAFKKGLEISLQLNYDEARFTEQIQQIQKLSGQVSN
jgi:tetratricopeptide (TPR) repeat protein